MFCEPYEVQSIGNVNTLCIVRGARLERAVCIRTNTMAISISIAMRSVDGTAATITHPGNDVSLPVPADAPIIQISI